MGAMDLKEIVAEMGRIAGVESLLAEFYLACAAACPGDGEFWKGLSAQERTHAAYLLEMAQLVNRSGGVGYTVSRSFPPAALRTFVAGVQANLEAVRNGALKDDRLYFVSHEIEHALLESRFHELLKTDDAEYNTLLRKVADETGAHRATLDRKVRAIRGGG